MPELSDIDFKILEFISKNEPVEIEKIKSEFPDILSIDYRIGQMSEMDFNEASHCYLPNTSFIAQEYEKPTSSFETKKSLGIYRITDMGKKSLQDYKARIKQHKKEIWLKNAWIPITVSIITTVLITYIIPKLPSLLKWLTNILERMV